MRSQNLLLALAVAGVLSSAAASAAQPGAPQQGLAEIVVTAERREEGVQTTPVAVTALDAAALSGALIENTQDVAKVVPNLKFLPLTASRSTLQISLRGGSEQAGGLVTAESPVAFYVDDVYVGRLAGSNLELADVARIEVLRGPQGTLYGRNAFSGAVKVVTRTPENEGWLDVAAAYGEFDEIKGSFSVGGPLADGWGASFSTLYRERDGFIRNVALGRDVYGEENFAARGKLHWFGNEAFRATLVASVLRDRNDGPANLVPITTRVPFPAPGPVDPGRFITTADVVPLVGFYTSQSPYAPNGATDQTRLSLDLAGDLGAVGWRSITAYIRTEDQFAFDLSGGRPNPPPQTGFRVQGLARTSDSRTNQFTQEFHLTSADDGGPVSWIVGAFYLQEDSVQVLDDFLDLAPGLAFTVLPQTIDTETRSYAAFAQGTWRFTDRLAGTLGLRWSRDDKELNGLIQNRLPLGPGPAIALVPVVRDPSFESWTPKAGLDFRVTEDLFTYVSVSRGFKAGGFNGLAVANPAVFGTVYRPQTMWAYEAGLKATFADNRVRTNLAIFRNEIDALQQTIQIGPGSFSVQNVGDARVDGLELEFAAVPVQGLTLFLNGGLMEDSYRRLAPLSEAAQNGARRLPLLSRWNYRAGFLWESQPLGGTGLRLRAGADWTEVGDYFSVVNNRLRTDGFGLLDASVGVSGAGDRWAVTLAGRNLNDKTYFTTAATSDAIAVGEPRTWLLSVRFSQ